MSMQTKYVSCKHRWTISSNCDFPTHQQSSQRSCCLSQLALLWLEVLPDLSPALPCAPKLISITPIVLLYQSSEIAVTLKANWNALLVSSEIDTFKFILHIHSDSPGGFQRLRYILLMDFSEAKLSLHISPVVRQGSCLFSPEGIIPVPYRSYNCVHRE